MAMGGSSGSDVELRRELEKFNSSSTRLSKAMIFIGCCQLVLAVVQVYLALKK